MSFVKALANRILQNNVRLLEEPDIWKLYHLMHFHKVLVSSGSKTLQRADKLPEQNVSLREQYDFVHSEVENQVISRLKAIDENSASLSRELPTESISNTEFTLKPLKCSPSNPIPGVLVRKGCVLPGAVVCFFPGKVYLPSQLREIPDYPDISINNPYLMSRTDGSIIDAKDYNEGNPLAVGHLVRHPPKGKDANVMPFSFDIGPSFPQKLLHLMPNKYHRKPGFLFSTRRVLLRTLVFVTTKQVEEGDELFLNYRLHPDSNLPDWYSSVDNREDRKRWR